ncbi:MAG: pyrimidine-nucleoside phosphorylase, partial [Acholeplasmataceae bacterium]|nr:pyrimidine-nucleoside phosphorylase [Acholeplasmataceae bacterium]
KAMITYQGGDVRVIDDYSLFPTAKEIIPITSKQEGYVQKVHALAIGKAAMLLGAGRRTKNDKIDLAVGVRVMVKVGDYVKPGQVLAYVHTNGLNTLEAAREVEKTFVIVQERITANKIVLDRVI